MILNYLSRPLPKSLQQAGERVRRMEGALRQYADMGNWGFGHENSSDQNGWHVTTNGYDPARTALAEAAATDE